MDELHKFRRWKSFLKGFFDTYGDRVRLLVTGSSRLDVFRRGGDSLMGRYFSFRMHPLSVAEIAAVGLPEYVTYTTGKSSFKAAPQKSLAEHHRDRRPTVYSAAQLENAQTHDPYWNAAMREMVCTGFMHTYMRMYWGKKILEWSPTPEEGFATTLALNNRYFIDGRDPN